MGILSILDCNLRFKAGLFSLIMVSNCMHVLGDKLLCGLGTDHDFRLDIDGMIYILTTDFNPAKTERVFNVALVPV